MKIAVALPGKTGIKAETAMCLMGMFSQIVNKYGSACKLTAYASVDEARNLIVDQFLKTDCTHLLFIDWDMVFPENACEVLLEADKNIIGCNAAKHVTGEPVVLNNIDGEPLSYVHHQIEKVSAIGMAVTLIKRKVFEKMEWPWFHRDIIKDQRRLGGEDFTFCRTAKQVYGYDTWVHNRLSIEIGHIGEETKYLVPHIQKQIEAHKKEQYVNELQKLKDDLV